ncbi:hypothetical protein LDB17_01520 [Dysgonomonas sp. Shenzhen-Wh21]|uniref:hypothetical protein n=1 Tax=Dysgonomonas TaxID=156973 RepID=UPI00208F2C76|nr:hypothetical protein [Dysgonomonas mossii]
MEILYQGRRYNAYPSDHFAIEEAVCVNGITGYISHVSYVSVWIVDEQDKQHEIMFVDIDSVYILYRNGFRGSNGKRQRIMPYNWRGVKNKHLKQITV